MRTKRPFIALGLKYYSCLSRSFRPSSVQLAKRTPSYSQVTSPCSANTSKASSPELIAMLSRTPSSRRRYCSVIQARALSAFCSALSPWKVVCWATCRNPVMGLTFISVRHGSSIACLRLTAMGSNRAFRKKPNKRSAGTLQLLQSSGANYLCSRVFHRNPNEAAGCAYKYARLALLASAAMKHFHSDQAQREHSTALSDGNRLLAPVPF